MESEYEDLVSLSLGPDAELLLGMEVFRGCSDTSIVCATDGAPIVLSGYPAGTFLIRVFSLDARAVSGLFELHVVVDHTSAVGGVQPWSLSVYPNPGSGQFSFIPAFSTADGTITIRDMAGRAVYQEQASFNEGRAHALSLRGKLKAGAYVLEIASGEARSVARLLMDSTVGQ